MVMADKYKLPVNYHSVHWTERKKIREQYIEEQKNLCFYCKEDLYQQPPITILEKKIDWDLFPEGFLKYPIHLQHDHVSGMTEGAIHAYCNAVMWQYEGK